MYYRGIKLFNVDINDVKEGGIATILNKTL